MGKKKLECPILAIPNFFQSFLFQKDLNKFGMPSFWEKIVRKSSEWLFLAIPNLCQSFGKIVRKKFGMALLVILNFFLSFLEKLLEEIQNSQKLPFQIISDIFPQKDRYKFRMAKNSHSTFFLTIFSKKIGRNLKWPKLVIPNFVEPFWYKTCKVYIGPII